MKIKVLDSIISLYALIAVFKPERGFSIITNTVDAYLSKRFSKSTRDYYINVFHKKVASYISMIRSDENESNFLDDELVYQCKIIAKNLDSKEKFLLMIHIIEYIPYISNSFVRNFSDQIKKLLDTIVLHLEIDTKDYYDIQSFVLEDYSTISKENSFFIICNNQINIDNLAHKTVENIDGYIVFLKIHSLDIILFKIFGNEEFELNDNHLYKRVVHQFEPGDLITTSTKESFYYNDVNKALTATQIEGNLTINVKNLEYIFPNGHQGIHPTSFSCSSGEIVAIMGGSGSGKTTLMNLLIGEYKPSKGEVTINGIDLYSNYQLLRGYIGYVPQDDALNEDLTAFDNLYYVAGLSLKNLSKSERIEEVEKILDELQLSSIRNLKVGNPLEKIISGGQRKRLNIAIELIRNPGILFLDEPTSGLSSADSEMLINLLRRVADNGRLVVLNIHQPSSDVFKRFDQLLFIDNGGYPVYFGPAINVLSYLKKALRMVDAQESQCGSCGNLNPEEIFHLVDSHQIMVQDDKKVSIRTFTPENWNTYFSSTLRATEEFFQANYSKLTAKVFETPNKITQFSIYFRRLLKSKFSASTSLLLNLSLPFILAFLLALFSYYEAPDAGGYSFYSNENIPPFLFMSVIVAIFLGIMSSASEINRDRRTLKREAFLDLSFGAYLLSRILYIFILNGIQMLSFVFVSSLILKIPSGFTMFFLIMWALAISSSSMGLLLSSFFKSMTSIYISIPFMLIPQILFSGAVIDFNKINKIFASDRYVPAISELMPSRWGYEALMINSFISSEYSKSFYDIEKDINQNSYFKNFLVPNIEKEFYQNNWSTNQMLRRDSIRFKLILNGIEQLASYLDIEIDKKGIETISGLQFAENIKYTKSILQSQSDDFINRQDSLILSYSDESYDRIINSYNSKVYKLLIDEINIQKVVVKEDEFIRKMTPIYFDATNKFGRAHQYAAFKTVGNKTISTLYFNLFIVLIMTLTITIFVYLIKPKY